MICSRSQQLLRPLARGVCRSCSKEQGIGVARSVVANRCYDLWKQQPAIPAVRCFTSTPLCAKKHKNKGGDVTEAKIEQGVAGSTEDPFDFAHLETDIHKAVEGLKDRLSKLRAGGRFNPELLENLRVQLTTEGKERVRLGDVAQVVPRGRQIGIIVGDKDHIKPVSSAILSSDLSLNPQPDAQNPSQLNVTIPPPTAESKKQAVNEAHKAWEKAEAALHDSRAKHQKKHRQMELGKKVRPDDLRKAHKMMEEIVKKGHAEVKSIYDAARRVLESG